MPVWWSVNKLIYPSAGGGGGGDHFLQTGCAEEEKEYHQFPVLRCIPALADRAANYGLLSPASNLQERRSRSSDFNIHGTCHGHSLEIRLAAACLLLPRAPCLPYLAPAVTCLLHTLPALMSDDDG